MLQQDLVDVKNKSRSNLFNWRGQFTPQLVEYLLDSFSKNGDVVLDVFSGSGTVLQEAASIGLEAHSFEINPSAFYMSSFFKLCNIEIFQREELFNNIKDILVDFINIGILGNDNIDDIPSDCIEYSSKIKSLKLSEIENIVLINILIKSRDFKKISFKDSVTKAFYFLQKSAKDLPYSDKIISPFLGDARSVSDNYVDYFDLTISSPPYINVFNYHQNYREVTEALKYEVLEIAKSEFGSNRKNRSNRFKTVVQYCLDMEETLYSVSKATKIGGKIVLVIGKESRVRNVPFYNALLVKNIAMKTSFLSVNHQSSRSFLNKFGENIIEEIIVFEKIAKEIVTCNATNIAKDAISNAIKNVQDTISPEILKELKSALDSVDDITASPVAFSS